MTTFAKFATSLAVTALLATTPACAQIAQTQLAQTQPAQPSETAPMGHAEKLRRLDIMLMVTGLRCRATADDFQADFQAFEASHMAELNAAQARLHSDMVARFGKAGANRELDRLSVTMANKYGGGHPWLSCHELKSAAQDLTQAPGEAPLLAAADAMLTGDQPPRIAYAYADTYAAP